MRLSHHIFKHLSLHNLMPCFYLYMFLKHCISNSNSIVMILLHLLYLESFHLVIVARTKLSK